MIYKTANRLEFVSVSRRDTWKISKVKIVYLFFLNEIVDFFSLKNAEEEGRIWFDIGQWFWSRRCKYFANFPYKSKYSSIENIKHDIYRLVKLCVHSELQRRRQRKPRTALRCSIWAKIVGWPYVHSKERFWWTFANFTRRTAKWHQAKKASHFQLSNGNWC